MAQSGLSSGGCGRPGDSPSDGPPPPDSAWPSDPGAPCSSQAWVVFPGPRESESVSAQRFV